MLKMNTLCQKMILELLIELLYMKKMVENKERNLLEVK